MTMHRLKNVLIAALVSTGTLVGTVAAVQANNLDSILKVGEAKNEAARKSQVKIDRLADETRDLLNDYKTVTKQIDGLKVYNTRLQRQIDNQNKRIGEIENSIDQVTVIQRQMGPLVERMIDGLEKFVELDVPFHLEERAKRIAFLRSNLDRSDVSVAEKFRQVLEAYKIENEYGRKIDAYKGSVDIDGVERDVNFFRVGRVALLYQTTDTEVSGAWDQANRSWVPLDRGEYRNAIMKGLRIARKEASIDLINLPVAAPEAM
jgi:predicted RNase H-like nuclease (RuvC/YqgF family)